MVVSGVVLALLPNALLGEFLKLFMDAHPMLLFSISNDNSIIRHFIIGVLAHINLSLMGQVLVW